MFLSLFGLGIHTSLLDIEYDGPTDTSATSEPYDMIDFYSQDMEFSYGWLRPLPASAPLPARLLRKFTIWWRNTF